MIYVISNVISAALGIAIIVYALRTIHKWSKLADRINAGIDETLEEHEEREKDDNSVSSREVH